MLLLLATYGLGAAEILALRLRDLDWRAGVLRVRRPKTKVDIEFAAVAGSRQGFGRILAMGTASSQRHTESLS